jgi:regulator of sigma E protease
VITKIAEPFWRAIPMGITECYQTFILFKNSIIGMVIGTTPVVLVGPVGVAQMTGEAVQAGFSPLLEFAAIFSICIGVFNLFPLPALDGGRIVFVLLEWVRRGKRVAARTEGLVHLIGFMLLLAVVLVVTYQDIGRLISGTGF